MASDSTSPKISVIIPALNEAQNLGRTVEQLQATLPPAAEILVVDDGSNDGSAALITNTLRRVRLLRTHQLGCAGARNYGARYAAGEILVFADAHVDTPPGWWRPLAAALDRPGVGAVGPAISALGRPKCKGFGMRLKGPDTRTEWLRRQGQTPYPVPILCSAFLAMRRETFEITGGFDSGLIRWGSNDAELSIRLWLMGYALLVVPQVTVAHLFRQKPPYAINWLGVLHNVLRLAFLHLNPERIAQVVKAINGQRDFAAALAWCVDSDIWTRRAQLLERRVRDDDWFFQRFGLTLEKPKPEVTTAG